MEDKTAVEAALFAATGPVTVEDVVAATGLPTASVQFALRDLKREYEERGSAIVISRIGKEYRMVLRADCARFTDAIAEPEMSGGTMRTLSTIAYNQPVLQSRLVSTRGPRAYEDVQQLVALGYVSAVPKGQTFELATTKKFADHFGIGSTKKADIKRWIESMAKEGRERGTNLYTSIYDTDKIF